VTGAPGSSDAGADEGLERRVSGRGTAGLHYGYRIPADERGLRRTGVRVIHPEEARVVVRIYEMFVSGLSPHAIARHLNAEGVPGKDGRRWTDSMIRGHPKRGSGILRNDVYVGRQILNRQRVFKDPASGREIARPNPESEWVVSELPGLEIVPQDLWDRAQARLEEMRVSAAAQAARRNKIWVKRPPKHLLDGLLVCAACGRSLLPTRPGWVSCRGGGGRRREPCRDPAELPLALFEEIVLDFLRNRIGTEAVAAAVRRVKVGRRAHDTRAKIARTALKREHDSVARELSNLVAAIGAGVRAPEVRQRVDELSRRRAEVAERLAKARARLENAGAAGVERFRTALMLLDKALRPRAKSAAKEDAPERLDEALMRALRGVFEKISVRRTGDRIVLELFGDVAEIFDADADGGEEGGDEARPRVALVAGTWHKVSKG
jgi:site-specific DNA recombinase